MTENEKVGMTENKKVGMKHSSLCHVEQAKRAFHLAEALIEKRHYLALAAQSLNNNNNPAAGN